MIEIDILDTTLSILFQMFKKDLEAMKKNSADESLCLNYFSIFTYNEAFNQTITQQIESDLKKINDQIVVYKKSQTNDEQQQKALSKIRGNAMTTETLLGDFAYCILMARYLPFESSIKDSYVIPQEYFKGLEGKKIVEAIYANAFQKQNVFTDIQIELLKVFKQKKLRQNASLDDLFFYRGNNIDKYYKKNLALLIDFADIFNKATKKNDILCMQMALRYIEDCLLVLENFFHDLGDDIIRQRAFPNGLEHTKNILSSNNVI
jgi:hypothetical protein